MKRKHESAEEELEDDVFTIELSDEETYNWLLSQLCGSCENKPPSSLHRKQTCLECAAENLCSNCLDFCACCLEPYCCDCTETCVDCNNSYGQCCLSYRKHQCDEDKREARLKKRRLKKSLSHHVSQRSKCLDFIVHEIKTKSVSIQEFRNILCFNELVFTKNI